jgi:ubiquinone/menaquinone biosynthesis C-methylase UbiE
MDSELHSTMNSQQARDLSYSLRRHFVDQFHFQHVSALRAGSRVLDLGGKKTGKRGLFDIESYDVQVVFANVDELAKPDTVADAVRLPFASDRFDAIICSELLEHVPDPRIVVREIHRILKPGGQFLACVPFMNRIHQDPHDYGRYTDLFWTEALDDAGFAEIDIEKQGQFWSVLIDMVRDLTYNLAMEGRPRPAWLRRLFARAIAQGKIVALRWDAGNHAEKNACVAGTTTGFGITATKQ